MEGHAFEQADGEGLPLVAYDGLERFRCQEKVRIQKCKVCLRMRRKGRINLRKNPPFPPHPKAKCQLALTGD